MKVRLAGETVPSVVSLLVSATVTLAVGRDASITVKIRVRPAGASVVTSPEVGVTVMPGDVVVGVGDRDGRGGEAIVVRIAARGRR